GVGQVIQELISALDSTLVQRKLIVAVVASLSLGVLLGFPTVAGFTPDEQAGQVTILAVAVGSWLITAAATALLTQMTFIEVSRLRPARWNEAAKGIGWMTFRIALVHFVVIGGVLALIYFLRQAPGRIDPSGEMDPRGLRHLFATWMVVLSLVLEIGL